MGGRDTGNGGIGQTGKARLRLDEMYCNGDDQLRKLEIMRLAMQVNLQAAQAVGQQIQNKTLINGLHRSDRTCQSVNFR